MGCFPCFSSSEKEEKRCDRRRDSATAHRDNRSSNKRPQNPKHKKTPENRDDKDASDGIIAGHEFTFRELASATNNFRPEFLLGEGGLGRVYKGWLEKRDKVVAVKQLDRNGLQGHREFLVEVLMLSLLHHQNLVNLIRYCADGDQRLLAQPNFKDPKRFPELADPTLQGNFPAKGLNQAVAVAAMCLQEEASVRPLITDVVIALSFLSNN